MRILLLNPNTSPAITALGLSVARRYAASGTEFVGCTGRFGATYIATRAAAAIAGHAVLDAYARERDAADVVLIACFGDPGLFALRELASVPVVGMAEASCHVAATLGRRFSIVTGGDRWKPMLSEFVATIGLADRLASIRTISLTGDKIAAEPERALDALAACCLQAVHTDGAGAVILGGLGLAGLGERIADRIPVPLVDSLVASVSAAERVGQTSLRNAGADAVADAPPVESLGLPDALSRLLARR